MSILAQDTIVISPATVNRIESEIDEIRNNTDVADVVANYAELEAYDTSKLTDNAIIKVLSDEEHENAQTYYRWSVSDQEFSFIGSIGPFYTKAESDELLLLKQNRPLSATQNNIATWDNDRHTVDSGKSFTTSVADESTASDNKIPTEKAVRTELDTKVDKNADVTAGTHTKITYDAKGLVTGGSDIVASDVTDLTATASEINQLHSSSIVTADLAKLHNVTADANELNVLDGITASTTELNYVDGVTSAIQTQLDNKVDKTNTEYRIYGTNSAGGQTTIRYSSQLDTGESIVQRTSSNQINVALTPTQSTHAASKQYVDNADSGKVDKTNSYWQVYATDNSGQTTLSYSSVVSANSIAQRDANSQINVNLTPTADNNATSKKYVDDKVTAAVTEAVVFKGVVANQTALPSSGNTNGDMYWITEFVDPVPTGMHEGRSGSAIYHVVSDQGAFEYTEDAIYQPDEQTIDLNGNGKLAVLISETEGNTIASNNDGLYVDQSGKVDKVTTTNRVYGTDANGAQTTYDKNSFGQVDDVKVDNVSVVTNKIASIDLSGKQDKPTITASTGATLSVTLTDNTIFNNTNAGLTTLTIINPTTPTADFASQINFTSGSTATVVNASNVVWMGDNVSEIAGFVPRTNCRYTIDFVYDGSNIRGYIQGVSL